MRLDGVDALIVLDDLAKARPPAVSNYEASARFYRCHLLRWIKLVPTPSTRRKRMARVVDFAA